MKVLNQRLKRLIKLQSKYIYTLKYNKLKYNKYYFIKIIFIYTISYLKKI